VFAAFALLVLPNALDVRPPGPTGRLARWTDLALGVAIWVGWFTLWRRPAPALAWAGALALSWWPLSVALRWQVGSPVTPLALGVIGETGPAELVDFLSVKGWLLAALALPAWGGGALAWWLARRHALVWPPRLRRLGLVAAVALIGAVPLLPAAGARGADEVEMPMNADDPQARPWEGVFPLDLPRAAWVHAQDQRRIAAARGRLAGFDFAPRTRPGEHAELLVLVIGESARADRWQLTGGPRETTPRLAALEGLVPLRDVIARSVATRTAVPAIVARQPVLLADGRPNPDVEPSVLAALGQAGWRTAWLSNQGASGVDAAVSFHARDAQVLRFLNPGSYAERGSLDEVLLAPLERELQAAGGAPALVVLHTLGNHFNYAHRHPPAFNHFRPSLSDRPFDPALSSAQEIENAYDNATRYADHVLAEVIDRVRATGRRAAVVYVSDHGEDLREPGCMALDFVRQSAASFRVPAFVWASPSLRQADAARWAALQAAADRPQAHDFVVETLLDLAGVTVAPPRVPGPGVGLGQDVSRPVARWVSPQSGGRVDFDAAVARNRCVIR
jgi:glucan phosphoethanolaminetransferase (alkaline phosphatase superfamily)